MSGHLATARHWQQDRPATGQITRSVLIGKVKCRQLAPWRQHPGRRPRAAEGAARAAGGAPRPAPAPRAPPPRRGARQGARARGAALSCLLEESRALAAPLAPSRRRGAPGAERALERARGQGLPKLSGGGAGRQGAQRRGDLTLKNRNLISENGHDRQILRHAGGTESHRKVKLCSQQTVENVTEASSREQIH